MRLLGARWWGALLRSGAVRGLFPWKRKKGAPAYSGAPFLKMRVRTCYFNRLQRSPFGRGAGGYVGAVEPVQEPIILVVPFPFDFRGLRSLAGVIEHIAACFYALFRTKGDGEKAFA